MNGYSLPVQPLSVKGKWFAEKTSFKYFLLKPDADNLVRTVQLVRYSSISHLYSDYQAEHQYFLLLSIPTLLSRRRHRSFGNLTTQGLTQSQTPILHSHVPPAEPVAWIMNRSKRLKTWCHLKVAAYSNKLSWSNRFSSFSWCWIYALTASSSLPTVET